MIKMSSVNSLPPRTSKKSIQPFLDEFMNGDLNIVQLIFDVTDYKSPRVCYNVWWVAVKRSKYPIKVVLRNNRVYLVRNLEPFIFDSHVFRSQSKAESFLNDLRKVVEDYGYVSVADLCDLLELKSEYSDNKQGWTDLSDAIISKVDGLYRVDLPKPQKV